MAQSEVDICNLALGWLGGNIITSLNDQSTEAKLCKANYELCRDVVLEERDWTFASTRLALAPATPAPEFGEYNGFQIPSDAIRILDADADPDFRYKRHWLKEENFILMNNDVCYIRYTKQIDDPTKFSKGFDHAFAARLALDICIPLTHSRELQVEMANLYASKLQSAGAMDGLQGKNRPIGTTRLIRVR